MTAAGLDLVFDEALGVFLSEHADGVTAGEWFDGDGWQIALWLPAGFAGVWCVDRDGRAELLELGPDEAWSW